jgi:serine/threonine protein kinase
VYKAKWNATGTYVALKVVPLHVEQEGVPTSALREISLLRELQHPCVVSLLDIQYATASNVRDLAASSCVARACLHYTAAHVLHRNDITALTEVLYRAAVWHYAGALPCL